MNSESRPALAQRRSQRGRLTRVGAYRTASRRLAQNIFATSNWLTRLPLKSTDGSCKRATSSSNARSTSTHWLVDTTPGVTPARSNAVSCGSPYAYATSISRAATKARLSSSSDQLPSSFAALAVVRHLSHRSSSTPIRRTYQNCRSPRLGHVCKRFQSLELICLPRGAQPACPLLRIASTQWWRRAGSRRLPGSDQGRRPSPGPPDPLSPWLAPPRAGLTGC
jgi:hypothetical protein